MKLELPGKTTADDITGLANVSVAMLQKIRDSMLEPFPRKKTPLLSSSRVQEICGIDRQRMNYALKKGDLPQGQQSRPGAPRSFSIEETIQWVRTEAKPVPRKGKAKVITVANFKGGVTKTTTTMGLGQGLTMRRGRKVCHVDLDPQGSLTTLFGINPHAEIDPSQTVYALVEAYSEKTEFDMRSLPQQTYWPNLDLIPSSTDLFNAEFMLPARARIDGPSAAFEKVLSDGFEQLKDEYDYIIVDTPPTLSYLTINAIYAADSVIIPVVPDVLSLASMVQFFQLFSDLVNGMRSVGLDEHHKDFDFLDILITRMVQEDSPKVVRDWVQQVYGSRVLPIEIPETVVARNANLRFSTVYDLASTDVNAESLRRIRPAFDQLVDRIDDKFCALWQRG
ncbi:ParA family protein [Cupriavidus sp. TMH.W2]|uniref:ParA family protein n=1 Tax=Cupriavidus sp. TMH.W2 TaxID=3434465 RepID=UPI003D77EC06